MRQFVFQGLGILLLATLLAFPRSSRGEFGALQVDPFQTPAFYSDSETAPFLGGPQNVTFFSSASADNAVGGFRKVFFSGFRGDLEGFFPTEAELQVAGTQLRGSTTLTTDSIMQLMWDGTTSFPPGTGDTLTPPQPTNFRGLGGLDLTVGCQQDALAFSLISLGEVSTLILHIWTDQGQKSTFTTTLPQTSQGDTTYYVFPYSDFVGNADFTDVGAISLELRSEEEIDLQMSRFATASLVEIYKRVEILDDVQNDGRANQGERVRFLIEMFVRENGLNIDAPGTITLIDDVDAHNLMSLEPGSISVTAGQTSTAGNRVLWQFPSGFSRDVVHQLNFTAVVGPFECNVTSNGLNQAFLRSSTTQTGNGQSCPQPRIPSSDPDTIAIHDATSYPLECVDTCNLPAVPCSEFRIVDGWDLENLPEGYQVVGPNLILDDYGKLVLTDTRLVQTDNFTIIQGVTAGLWGDPLCMAVIDCAAAGRGHVEANVVNVQRDLSFGPVVLEELCSNPGVFFGCVDTNCVPADLSPDEFPLDAVGGEWGDELKVLYTSLGEIGGEQVQFEWSVWLASREHPYWTFEHVTDLMIRDSIRRNINKLQGLKKSIERLSDLLYNGDEDCEEIGLATSLEDVSIASWGFLDQIESREQSARNFLKDVAQYNQLAGPSSEIQQK